MNFTRCARLSAAIIALLLAALVAYELIRILSARRNVETIFATYLASPAITLRIEDMTSWQIETLLKIQDPGFYEHHGVDGRTLGSGRTTITQSLVKRFYFQKFKPGFAKIEQTLIAKYAVDPAIDKASQLTAFINLTPMGRCGDIEMTGFEAATNCYYQKRVQDLSKNEFIGLITVLIGPYKYNPLTKPQNHQQRADRIKRLLAGDCAPLNSADVYYAAC